MRYKNVYISLLLIILVIANDGFWQSFILGLIFGLVYIFWHSYLLGRRLFKRETVMIQIITGSFLILALISILGTAFYYFYKLTPLTINLVLILIPLIIFIFELYIPRQLYKIPISSLIIFINRLTQIYLKFKNFTFQLKHHKKKFVFNFFRDSGLAAAYVILTIINWVTIFKSITSQTINSLWDALTPQFLITYFLATIILIIITTTKHQRNFNLILVRSHVFMTLALAAVIYNLGYGFDPFIHQATERVIVDQGFITPKVPYYIGQYSIVIIFMHLFQLPLDLVDVFLLPLLFSIFIPAFIYLVYRQIAKQNLIILNQEQIKLSHFYYLLPLTLLIIPFSDFITTTPQGLANFFALVIIIVSILLVNKKVNYNFSYLLIFLGLTTLLIHPLTGIPILIFSILTFLVTYNFKHGYWRKIIISLLIIATLASLPATFLLQSFLTPDISNPFTLDKLTLSHLKETFQPAWPTLANKSNIIQDYFHLFASAIKWLLVILAAAGYYLLRFKNKEKKYYIYPLFFILMILTYALLRIFIDFQSVIFYEQNNYPARILHLSFYFLVPLILYALYQLTQKILAQKLLVRFFFILILAGGITSTLYISYPYDDAYQISHYYSTSQNDIQAVDYIKSQTTGDYIVLANQAVSAAALRQFGFKKYYSTDQGELFYYPIPTASPLYQYYLDMVYQAPTRQTMIEAMNLVNVNQAYFVINKYWTDFDKIVPRAMAEANEWQVINQGEVYIFYFVR